MFSIAVIGSGVIGLPTALSIQSEFGRKAKVVIFTEKLSPNTTGDVAAGLWTPYLLQDTPPDRSKKWAKDTQDYILDMWKKGQAKDAGISLQTVVNLSDERDFQVPDWLDITLGYSTISDKQLEKYGKRYGRKFTGGFTYMAFIWEASKFLPLFEKQFLAQGGEIRIKNIQDFEELLQFDLVVNCTGLNSRFLVPDSEVYPIRGQIARVYAPGQFQCFMYDSDHCTSYIIPNQECVIIGGTHQDNDFNTSIDENDKKMILEGCCKLVPSLEKAPVVRHQAGLRPARNKVRLEIEEREVRGKLLKIVHNYGHGGSGVTLSVGCAKEAAVLAKEALGFGGDCKL